MRQDFVNKLELQLLDAAAREARPRIRLRVAPRRLAPALALLVVAAIAAVLVAAALRARDTVPTRPAPHVIANTPLVGQGGTITSAFGAVWAADIESGNLLRLDPRTRAVQARIPLGDGAFISTGAGAVWAFNWNQVLKIDPARNRVVARITLSGLLHPADVLRGANAMWLIGTDQMARIDVRRNTVDPPITISRQGFHAVGGISDGRSLYVTRADGRLLSYDARTGKRLSSVRAAATGLIAAVTDDSVIVENDTGVVALDPDTGRARWHRELGVTRVNNAALSGQTLWVQASDRATHRDRLWRIDARSGEVSGAVTLPEFGAASMTVVGNRVWIISTQGDLMVVE